MNTNNIHPDAILLALETQRHEIDYLVARSQKAADMLRFSLRPKAPDAILKQVALPNGKTVKRVYHSRKEINRDFDVIGMVNTEEHKAICVAWEKYEADCATVDHNPEVITLQDEADKWAAEQSRVDREIATTRADTVEGVAVKLRFSVGADPIERNAKPDELAIRTALADCERMVPASATNPIIAANVRRPDADEALLATKEGNATDAGVDADFFALMNKANAAEYAANNTVGEGSDEALKRADVLEWAAIAFPVRTMAAAARKFQHLNNCLQNCDEAEWIKETSAAIMADLNRIAGTTYAAE